MDSFLSFLSLCKKAGKAVCGASGTYQAAKDHKAKLLIVAIDASGNTKKDAKNISQAKGVHLIERYTKLELGHATGGSETAMIAVVDSGFANQLIKLSTYH